MENNERDYRRLFDRSIRLGLTDLLEKVNEGQRLNFKDALRLYQCEDLNFLGAVADRVARKKNGERVSYILNRYLNYSNICILSCQFCAFYRRENQPGSFTESIEQLVNEAEEAAVKGATEVHCVGGLHPKLPYSYYLELVRAIKQRVPQMMMKAFTAVEIRHLAKRIAKKPIVEVLHDLASAGLDALTGGGAEIFDAEVRRQICLGKESAEEWMEVHRLWHNLGKKSTATMLFGHVETFPQRIDHLFRLRDLQEETGGFCAFIPFAFEPANTKLSHIRKTSGVDFLKTIALSRLCLDNFDHITAYWISSGMAIGELALNFGADDLHGTIEKEKIFHMAGANTPPGQTVDALKKAIENAGKIPVRRDTYYRIIEPISLRNSENGSFNPSKDKVKNNQEILRKIP
ncbi:radical SAM protein [Methylacidiphilum kamchatkense Kam1]|uniref:Aminodeoxyfutalosine synthase n=1 Tax=Methylacidiphilum kamchatkense Kam1 TaxID=1202785 RepID=A0A0C1V2Y9_9BACT|nr:aminofutalosine synthase MqnE [Methylacidiphilum kamchatkense]KIE58040.1 radical SAM protein [Methylacidiphilum kamchatkense Kam1]QDQ41652.1 aminodeoxyfutalosine synthase [Methylacidiphilum kamchatkense Kam1]